MCEKKIENPNRKLCTNFQNDEAIKRWLRTHVARPSIENPSVTLHETSCWDSLYSKGDKLKNLFCAIKNSMHPSEKAWNSFPH